MHMHDAQTILQELAAIEGVDASIAKNGLILDVSSESGQRWRQAVEECWRRRDSGRKIDEFPKEIVDLGGGGGS